MKIHTAGRTQPGHSATTLREGRGGLGRPLRQTATMMAWGPGSLRSTAARWAVNVLALTGAVLIVVSAVIHLRLWGQGYGSISVIGPLFLAQGVVALVLAVALGIFRWLGLMVAGAGLMAATAVGLLLSTQISLFGFRDSLGAPYAGVSLVVEFGGAGLLAAGAGLILAARYLPARRPREKRHAVPEGPPHV